MEDNKTLGARIQAHRRRMGISQEQLAERLGVSRQAVSKWELDESLPELDKALALCRVFGVSADLLLQGSPSPQQRALAAGAARRLLPAAGTALVALGLFCSMRRVCLKKCRGTAGCGAQILHFAPLCLPAFW